MEGGTRSRRDDGDRLTAVVVLRQLSSSRFSFGQWIVDAVNRAPDLLDGTGVTLETFNRRAKEDGFTPTPPDAPTNGHRPSAKPRRPPELIQESVKPYVLSISINLMPPPEPLTADQVPPRIFQAAEKFAHDFGLSTKERDEVIRAVRREFPGEYPNDEQILLTFYKHLP